MVVEYGVVLCQSSALAIGLQVGHGARSQAAIVSCSTLVQTLKSVDGSESLRQVVLVTGAKRRSLHHIGLLGLGFSLLPFVFKPRVIETRLEHAIVEWIHNGINRSLSSVLFNEASDFDRVGQMIATQTNTVPLGH